jgi:hypothetical protein
MIYVANFPHQESWDNLITPQYNKAFGYMFDVILIQNISTQGTKAILPGW